MPLSYQSYVFDPRPSYELVTTVKKFWDPESPYLDDPEALTLILTHGTGFHKEQWEPVIEDMYGLVQGNTVRIREIWILDAPNHGDAAILNEKTLQVGYTPTFAWEEYGRSIHLFLAGCGKGIDVDFSKRNLVGIGHSMGGVGLVLAAGYFPQIKFQKVILCEIMTMPEYNMSQFTGVLEKGSVARRDIWQSKDEAYKLLKSRGSWKTWDDRTLRAFVDHGLRPLPTLDYPDKIEGVTLKCSRIQETATYSDQTGTRRAYRLLPSFVERFPTHLIYGTVDDYIPAEAKEVLVRDLGGVGKLASFSRVPGAGHLIVQTHPSGLAREIYGCLTQGDKKLPSRL